jgi:very-short-patch-repair endonuclease
VLEELASPGRKGVRPLRAVLATLEPGTDSELEARFRDLLRRHGLPQPERQVVLGSRGEQAGRVDCVFRDARLVVELDGRPYHSSKLDRLEDGRRDLVLLRGGFRVLRLTWHHVVEQEGEVAAALRELLSCAA